MKKELSLQTATRARLSTPINSSGFFESIRKTVEAFAPLIALAALYSKIMEQTIHPIQTLKLLHAQIACFSLVAATASSLVLSFLFFLWTMVALWQCKQAFR